MKLTLFPNLILFLFLMLIFSSCKNLSSDPKQLGTDKITGKVTIDGILVTDVNIKVDDVANWQTKTDANGNFRISTLTDGQHTLYVEKDLSSGEVISYQTTINLTQSETDFGNIDFSKPVKISNSGLTISAIPLSWEKSTSTIFKEYKVYRHEGAGVDNNIGELVFSTPAKSDTQFTDYKFINGTQYSYRVYIVSGDQKLSGSNAITLNSVADTNLISNGRFEISSDGIKPDFWQVYHNGTPSYNVFTVDGSEHVDGNTSLRINFIDSLFTPSPNGLQNYAEITQQIYSTNISSEKSYNLSFWIKTENGGQARIILSKVGVNDTVRVLDYYGPSEYKWNQQNLNFVTPANTSYLVLRISTKRSQSVNGIARLWIDGVKLSPAQ
jgi:hypothetical protein